MPLLAVFLIIFIWIKLESSMSKQKIQKEKDIFWSKEEQSNSTRKVDISNLEYIQIPLETLPFHDTPDEELKYFQNNMKRLSNSPIFNLSGLSNADIKLKYGVANFPYLTECDNNFTQLVQELYKWSNYLYEHQMFTDALTVLEFGVQCKTDVSKHYILLANLYNTMSMSHKIDQLILEVEKLDTPLKDSTLSTLKKLRFT